MDTIINKPTLITYQELLKHLTDSRIKMHSSGAQEQIEILDALYTMCKAYSVRLYNQKYFYKNILKQIDLCEKQLSESYIITEAESLYRPNLMEVKSIEELLDYISNIVRLRILKDYNEYSKKSQSVTSLEHIDLTGLCEIASQYTLEECNKLGLKCRVLKIAPGYNDKFKLYDLPGEHYFCLVELANKEYLFDLTYKQFFRQDGRNILNRLGVPGLEGCAPGIYMTSNIKRMHLARTLINRGWIRFNSDNIKTYFDGFTLSYRNGIYYELLGKVDYNPTYTSNDYLNFLEGSDDMFKHEPRIGLGKQLRPLKNPYMDFNIK